MLRVLFRIKLLCWIYIFSNLAHAESLIPCGWGIMNLHEKSPDLIGYSVQQFPEWSKDHKGYSEGHPYLVVFLFRSGPSHLVFYSPAGQTLGGEWEELTENHWARKDMKNPEDLWHECRGVNLQYKPNKRL